MKPNVLCRCGWSGSVASPSVPLSHSAAAVAGLCRGASRSGTGMTLLPPFRILWKSLGMWQKVGLDIGILRSLGVLQLMCLWSLSGAGYVRVKAAFERHCWAGCGTHTKSSKSQADH